MMRFLKLDGPFCRTCGTAVLRDMTAKTMWQGWWSPISLVIITPFTLIWNAVVNAKLKKLAPPVPGQPGQQLDPGKPLLQRPAIYLALIPIIWFTLLIIQIVTDGGLSSSSGSSGGDTGFHASDNNKPQKTLKLGQPSAQAQEVQRNGKTGKFTITPQRVVMGKPSDLAELDDKNKDKYQGKTLAWVYVNAKLVGGDAPIEGPLIGSDVGVLSEGDEPGTGLILIGDLSSRPADCKEEDTTATWQKGDEHSFCRPFIVPDGKKLTTVTYSRGFSAAPLKWTVD
ncbi:hypothetical protein LKL35_30515 [Streptomyces sp. ET3-23]|uniref:hypothetical protein n=1 Tax=Streptomyces sp. ET3-23 TaxID=2885643 RepID=UPI001D0F83B7|nr:hypothetical protein [Streptomyces sp. ET3-23]MCC2279728.1 hypothetical protein [Streptomyces sp. ET3-23]